MRPRLLLDTHVVVRWLADPKELSRGQARILDAAVRRAEPVALSAITLLEIAVLTADGPLRLKAALDELLVELQANPTVPGASTELRDCIESCFPGRWTARSG